MRLKFENVQLVNNPYRWCVHCVFVMIYQWVTNSTVSLDEADKILVMDLSLYFESSSF